MSFKERHCKHCLKSVYKKGEENEYSVYYHYVLEAKLVVGDMVISIDSEFVENEDENVEKQDCEIRAFYRMTERIKKQYPKLPIIILRDALYECEPAIKRCKEKGLKYISKLKMRIKEVSATLTEALTQTITNLTEHKKTQLRFESG